MQRQLAFGVWRKCSLWFGVQQRLDHFSRSAPGNMVQRRQPLAVHCPCCIWCRQQQLPHHCSLPCYCCQHQRGLTCSVCCCDRGWRCLQQQLHCLHMPSLRCYQYVGNINAPALGCQVLGSPARAVATAGCGRGGLQQQGHNPGEPSGGGVVERGPAVFNIAHQRCQRLLGDQLLKPLRIRLACHCCIVQLCAAMLVGLHHRWAPALRCEAGWQQ